MMVAAQTRKKTSVQMAKVHQTALEHRHISSAKFHFLLGLFYRGRALMQTYPACSQGHTSHLQGDNFVRARPRGTGSAVEPTFVSPYQETASCGGMISTSAYIFVFCILLYNVCTFTAHYYQPYYSKSVSYSMCIFPFYFYTLQSSIFCYFFCFDNFLMFVKNLLHEINTAGKPYLLSIISFLTL